MNDNVYLASIYRLHGVNFWESAKVLGEQLEVDANGVPTKVTAIPFYFFASHAAELLLKAALLKRGFTCHDLKQFSYRHDLDALLQAVKDKGVAVTAETTEMIARLSDQHRTHALRYTALVDDGRPTYMPPQGPIFSMLTELLLLTRISTQGV